MDKSAEEWAEFVLKTKDYVRDNTLQMIENAGFDVKKQVENMTAFYKTAEKKKLGFPIPIRVWLREDAYYNRVKAMFASKEAEQFFDVDYLKQLLEEHKTEKHDNSRKIWTVYIFLIWYDRFFANGKPVHP